MKHISILGSTGSIGTQTLDIVKNNSELIIDALAVNSNIAELEKQAREFKPQLVCVYDKSKESELKDHPCQIPL